jgi:hypothetical protein
MITDTIKLEYALSAYARPTFLAITEPDEENDIQILISSNLFNVMDVEDRIEYVFKIIKDQCPEVVEDRLVVVQAYDGEEIEQVLDIIFKYAQS